MPNAEIRLAATLMIMSEDQSVLMVKRNEAIEFAGGAYVFPGGKINLCDYPESWGLLDQSGQNNREEQAAKIAAIRETFEETGILFAKNQHGEWVLNQYSSETELRANIEKTPENFIDFLTREKLSLQTQTLAAIAIWCPPTHIKKRFMTWFFIAIAPQKLKPLADNSEIVEAIWIAPNNAFAQAQAKTKKIIFPTRCNLALLADFNDNQSLWEYAISRPAPIINPEVRFNEGQETLCIPSDIGYPHWHEPLIDATH